MRGSSDEEAELLDLDDQNGAEVCKTYLCCIESLLKSLDIKRQDRSYREQFSNSYKVLYKQMFEQFNSECAYLTEILDSAQEAFDHLWVNGEKYVFSDHVVESGTELYNHFMKLKDFINTFYSKNFQYGMSFERFEFPAELTRFKLLLQNFDELWTTYEKKYVYELMVIEQDARRFVSESINLEGALMMLAKNGKSSDKE